jgi:hypothetical protein
MALQAAYQAACLFKSDPQALDLTSSIASRMMSETLFLVVSMIISSVSRSASLILMDITLYLGFSLILPI